MRGATNQIKNFQCEGESPCIFASPAQLLGSAYSIIPPRTHFVKSFLQNFLKIIFPKRLAILTPKVYTIITESEVDKNEIY